MLLTAMTHALHIKKPARDAAPESFRKKTRGVPHHPGQNEQTRRRTERQLKARPEKSFRIQKKNFRRGKQERLKARAVAAESHR